MVGGDGGLSRRGLLGAGVTLAGVGSAVVLGGCEHSEPAPSNYGRQDTDRTIDLAQLNEAVDLEYMAIAAYQAAIPLLRGADLTLGRRLLSQEQEHLGVLLGVFHHVKVTPDQPRASYGFPRLSDSAHALAFATEIENTAIATYIDALPKIVDPKLRAKFAAIMTNEAEHLAVLAGARGLPEAPSAFVRGRSSGPDDRHRATGRSRRCRRAQREHRRVRGDPPGPGAAWPGRGLAVVGASAVPLLLGVRNAFAQVSGDEPTIAAAVGLEQVMAFAYGAALGAPAWTPPRGLC